MRSDLNFNHLECFLVTARTRSFSAAARELGIAQPAVSRQIKSLEEKLGLQLFLRDKGDVKLTAGGEQLFARTSPLFESIIEESKNVQITEEFRGVIRFGCLTEVGERIFIPALSAFQKTHAKIRFEVQLLRAQEILEGLKAHTLDVGIIPMKIIQENVSCYELHREEILLVANKETAKKPLPKITELPFVAYRPGDPLLQSYLREVSPRSVGSKLDVQFYANSHKAMAQILLEHPFYAVLPRLSISQELHSGRLVDVGPKSLRSGLYLIQRDLDFPDPKLEALRKKLKLLCKDLR